MENKIFFFNLLIVIVYGILVFTCNYIFTMIYGSIIIFWLILNLPYFQKLKWIQKLFDVLYKLSFPYTTDEVIILNCMKIVNFCIAKRFQFLHYFKLINPKESKKTNKTIFYEDFSTFKYENWDKVFPWGNGNNTPENVYIENGEIITRMQKENFRGWWDGWKYFHNTNGMIYSKKTYPVEAIYEARIKFSNVDYINQAFWTLNIDNKDIVEEIDFEYHLSEKKITMTQHWGNCYGWENHFKDKAHRQDSFNFKINFANEYHTLKFKFTKNNIYWYIDNILVKWHFIGVPKLEQHIIFGMGNVNDGKDCTSTGKLDLNKLPTYFKCDWIKIDKNK